MRHMRQLQRQCLHSRRFPSCGVTTPPANTTVRSGPTGIRRTWAFDAPNCGERIDFHAGHVNNGHVFVCDKGRPLMREVRYYCRRCDSTVIFLKKCEQKEVNHD